MGGLLPTIFNITSSSPSAAGKATTLDSENYAVPA